MCVCISRTLRLLLMTLGLKWYSDIQSPGIKWPNRDGANRSLLSHTGHDTVRCDWLLSHTGQDTVRCDWLLFDSRRNTMRCDWLLSDIRRDTGHFDWLLPDSGDLCMVPCVHWTWASTMRCDWLLSYAGYIIVRCDWLLHH